MDNDSRSLIPLSDSSISNVAGANRLMCAMVGEALAFARDAAVVQIDIDALVGEAKRIQRREGMTDEDVLAFKLFHQAATTGHAEAQYLLSECYRYGYGIQKNATNELEWLVKSAESGFVQGQLDLGWRGITMGELPEGCPAAVTWYLKAAAQGDIEALNHLGECYFLGEGGVFVNHAEAVKWYRRAAERGHDGAQYCLGSHYAGGKGVAQDYVEAVKWFRAAAMQGHAEGQYNLGCHYQHGEGVMQDMSQAYKWIQLAADQGLEYAKKAAATLEVSMSPTELESAQHLYPELNEIRTLSE